MTAILPVGARTYEAPGTRRPGASARGSIGAVAQRRSQAGRKRARRRITDGPCHWCGRWCLVCLPVGHKHRATWDHLVTQSAAPGMGYVDLRNLVRACWDCNSRRQDRSPSVLGHTERPAGSRRW